MDSGTAGRNHNSGSASKGRSRVREYLNRTQAKAAASIAKTNDSPYTPTNGASRSGTDILIPAFPSGSHVNPNVACVRSRPVQSAATAGIAYARRMSGPANHAKTAKWSPFKIENSRNEPQPPHLPIPPCTSRTNWIQVHRKNQKKMPAAQP